MSHTTQQPTPRLRLPDRTAIDPVPRSLDELLPPEHLVRRVWDFTARLDLIPLCDAIRAVEGQPGRHATDPRLLFALWLYATVDGVGAARELDRLCREHLAYRWLCGGVTLNYHTLATFRLDHADLLDQLLTDVVAVLLDQNLITLNRVAQDGLKVRASAGKDSFHRQSTLERYRDEARVQVAALRQQAHEDPAAVSRRQQAARQRAATERQQRAEQALSELATLRAQKEARKKGSGEGEKTRASSTDPQARVMKMPDGGFRPAYNVQFATTTAGGVIVGVVVTQAGNDQEQLPPMMEQLHDRYERRPQEVVTDGDFASKDTIATLHDDGIAVYAPGRQAERQPATESDPYAAQAGDSPVVAAWRVRMGTPLAQELARLRGASAEWVSAGARQRGLQQFGVRGRVRVQAVVLGHNLLRTLTLEAARVQG